MKIKRYSNEEVDNLERRNVLIRFYFLVEIFIQLNYFRQITSRLQVVKLCESKWDLIAFNKLRP